MGALSTRKTTRVDNQQAIPEEGDSSAYRPGMALRVAIGFVAVALTVIAANVITQQSAREARERVRQLLVQHEPLVRTTESLAATRYTSESSSINPKAMPSPSIKRNWPRSA
jgi:hypothetical protein